MLERQIMGDRINRYTGRKSWHPAQSRQLGGKHQQTVKLCIIEWLLAKRIARQQQLSTLAIIEGKCKHPLEPGQKVSTFSR